MIEEPSLARRHRDVLARFDDLLMAGSTRALSEICRDLGVSARLLRACCQLGFGMSPTDYRRRCAMQQVNRHLRHGKMQELTIAEIARQHGLKGRFARDYRALYGELPSATSHRVSSMAP
jgi:AraC family transcriptional regulator, ethanolamine operon transcriptional activator